MVHVLVAHQHPGLRYALTSLLRQEHYLVTEVSDGVMAFEALWVARRPLVAVLDEQLTPVDAQHILDVAVDDEVPLARHRYIVLTTELPLHVRPALSAVVSLLNATLLYVPADMGEVPMAVADAALHLPRPIVDSAVTVPWPPRLGERLERLATSLTGITSSALPALALRRSMEEPPTLMDA